MKTQHPQIIPKHDLMYLIKEYAAIEKYLHKMPRHNIEIVFWGSDPWSVFVLKALEDNFEVAAVVTASDSAVANYFKGPIFTSGKLDENFKSQISDFKPDLFIVASYGKIIPKSILNIPKFGSLNIHPSLLSKYRGPSPVPATILAGDKITGVTIIKMDEEIDHGPIIATKEISLTGQENLLFLINKLFQLGADLLVKIIPDYIAGKIKLMPQNHLKATFTQALKKEDGYFDIKSPPSSEVLDRIIRAYYPWPGVWSKWTMDNGKLKIVKFLPNGLIQMEGKKAISLKDFLNGYPNFPIKNLQFPSK